MTGPLQQPVFTIDISRWEFCEGKTETKLEEFTIYVYTPSKVAVTCLESMNRSKALSSLRVGRRPL
jgi:hypothetical protein